MLEATTISGWALAIYRSLESYHLDPKPLFEQADIDLELARDPNARFPSEKTTRLMSLGVQASGDPAFGLTVGRHIRPTSFHALGYANWASRNLREAQERMCRYFKVFTTSSYSELLEDEEHLIVHPVAYPSYISILNHEHFEGFLSCIIQTARHLLPGRSEIAKVRLTRPRPQDTASFERFFKCPIEWESDGVYLYVKKSIMDIPLPTANPELAQLNEQLCKDYIARFDRLDIVNQVSNKLVETLPHGEPGMDRIATEMMTSSRTLQRKLRAKGTSYKQLLDDVRKEMALQYIRQSHVPIGEISYRLGFAHISNFSRAFKRWTGKTPIDYRDNPDS